MDKEAILYIIAGIVCIIIGFLEDASYSFLWTIIGILDIMIAWFKINNTRPPFSF